MMHTDLCPALPPHNEATGAVYYDYQSFSLHPWMATPDDPTWNHHARDGPTMHSQASAELDQGLPDNRFVAPNACYYVPAPDVPPLEASLSPHGPSVPTYGYVSPGYPQHGALSKLDASDSVGYVSQVVQAADNQAYQPEPYPETFNFVHGTQPPLDQFHVDASQGLVDAYQPAHACQSQPAYDPDTVDTQLLEFLLKRPPINNPGCISPSLILPRSDAPEELSTQRAFLEADCSDMPFPGFHGYSEVVRPSSPSPSSPSPASAFVSTFSAPAPASSFGRTSPIITKRRNAQVPATASPARASSSRRDRWQCPHCPHVQYNHRGHDLRRHIATHTSSENVLWICCGVPIVDAEQLGVPESLRGAEHVSEFEGILMVGGCKHAFSRKDAYARHLKRERGTCFGDALATYQPANSSQPM